VCGVEVGKSREGRGCSQREAIWTRRLNLTLSEGVTGLNIAFI